MVDQLVEAIESAIQRRVLRRGMPVPSIRQFAREYGISTFTVSAAYSRLVAQGLLSARAGAGYRVASGPGLSSSPALAPETAQRSLGWTPPQIGASWLLADVFADHSIPIKSGCGWLPSEWLGESGLQQSLRQVARTPVNQIAGYGHPYGYFPLRETVAQNLGLHGAGLDVDQVLLTQGATQGLDIVIRTLLRPGDTVAVEVPAYANLLQSLRLAGIRVLGVPRTLEGLCIATLQTHAEARPGPGIKALFVNTVLHNPTGASFTMANAFQVLQLADQHDFWVVEDDVSRDLLPGLAPMLMALAGPRRVVYVSGFSKSITPSMRVGYIVSGGVLLKEFAKTKMTLGLTTPEMMERTAHQVLRQGRHRAHLQKVRDRLAQAHDTLYDLMDQHDFQIFARPQAGLFVWARPAGPWRDQGAARLAELALKEGIWLAPGSYFDPDQTDTGWIRFNVAYSLHPALWQFMRRIGAAG